MDRGNNTIGARAETIATTPRLRLHAFVPLLHDRRNREFVCALLDDLYGLARTPVLLATYHHAFEIATTESAALAPLLRAVIARAVHDARCGRARLRLQDMLLLMRAPQPPPCGMCHEPGYDSCLRCGANLCTAHAAQHLHRELRSSRKPVKPAGRDYVRTLFVEVAGRPFAVRSSNNFQLLRRRGDAYDFYPLDIHVNLMASVDVRPLTGCEPWVGLLDQPGGASLPVIDGALVFGGGRAPLAARELLLETSVRRGDQHYALAIPIDRITGEAKPTCEELRKHQVMPSPSNVLDEAAWQALPRVVGRSNA